MYPLPNLMILADNPQLYWWRNSAWSNLAGHAHEPYQNNTVHLCANQPLLPPRLHQYPIHPRRNQLTPQPRQTWAFQRVRCRALGRRFQPLVRITRYSTSSHAHGNGLPICKLAAHPDEQDLDRHEASLLWQYCCSSYDGQLGRIRRSDRQHPA